MKSALYLRGETADGISHWELGQSQPEELLGKGQSARTCQPSLFFGSISKQQLSNAVVLALTFSYSPHYFYLVSCPHSHDFGSFSPHFSVLVPIALTLDFGSYSPHFSVLFQIALTS